MKITLGGTLVKPAFLTLGYCPSQRSGGYYDSVVLPVFLNADQTLLTAEWFDISIFPQASAWFEERENFYFPNGKDESRHWSETQYQIYDNLTAAERKAQMWEGNDISEEMPVFEPMSPQDEKKFSIIKESAKW